MKKCFYLSSLLVFCFSLFSGAASAQAIVTADPINVTACVGTTRSFGITATGATAYMWQVSADGGTFWDTVHNGVVYSSATTDTMHVVLYDTLNTHMYRCIALATGGNDTSLPATLHVDVASAGTISGPDAVCVGAHVTFTSTVPGGTWSNVFHAIDTITAGGIDTGRTAGTDTIKYSVTNTCGTSVSWKLVHVQVSAIPMAITGPTAVCIGNNIVLNNANVDGTGTWSSGNVAIGSVGATSGIVHGVHHGSVLISYTFTNACNTVISSTPITVDTAIAAGTITGPATVCSGSWVHLNESTTGGIWLSGNTSVAVVDGSGNVTGVSQGTSVISYYFSNSCGASFATDTFEVVVPVAPTFGGNDSVGIDSTLMLTNSTPSGIWTSNDVTIATIGSSNGLVTGIDTGVTTITYSVTNACGTSSATQIMNVGPLPFAGAINGPDTVCVGGTITLVDTTGQGFVTSWRSKYDSLATITPDGVVTAVGPGYDTVYATVTNAFGSVVTKRVVIVLDIPAVTVTGPATISLGGSYTLVGLPTGGTWTTSNPVMTQLIGYGFFVVMHHGTSVFTYTVTNRCGTSSATDTVSLDAVSAGVNNVSNETSVLNVFPNPSNGTVTVNLASGINESAVVTITNVTGELVKEFSIKSNVNSDFVLDQPAGVYLLSATTESGIKYSAKINIAK